MIDETKAQASKELLTQLIPTMEGWLSAERSHEMYELVRTTGATSLVEIGVFGGRSLLAQGLALRDQGRGIIIGIDPWKKEVTLAETDDEQAAWWREVDLHKIHNGCMEALWAQGLDEHVLVLRACSHHCHEIIPRLDILYIDGSHTETSSCRDVELYLPKVKQNGYVWFDDADWDTTQKALGMLDAKCKLVRDMGGYRLYCKYG